MAATTAEARFRISYPFRSRDSRIVAVDTGAVGAVHRAAQRRWSGLAHFLIYESSLPDGGNGRPRDALLRHSGGDPAQLSDELTDADVIVMVAGSAGAKAASVIGNACAERRIMTAGVVVGDHDERVNDAVRALRPYAMVLVSATDDEDLFELLTALRV